MQQLEEELYGKPTPEPEKMPTPIKGAKAGGLGASVDIARKGGQASPSTQKGSDEPLGMGSRRASKASLASHGSRKGGDETKPLLGKVGEEDSEEDESEEDGDEEEVDGEGKGAGGAEEEVNETGSVSSGGKGAGGSKDEGGAPIKVHVSGGKFGSEDEWDEDDDDSSEWTFGSTSVASSKRGTMDSNVLSPGKRLTARGSKQHTARGVSIVSGPPREPTGGNTCLYSISVKQGPIRQLALSPDGLILVAACEGKIIKGMLVVYDGTVRFLAPYSFNLTNKLPPNPPFSLQEFSPLLLATLLPSSIF